VRVDRALVGLEGDAVNRIEELAPREDSPELPRERFEELELGWCQVDVVIGDLDAHPVDLPPYVTRDHEVAGGFGGLLLRGPPSRRRGRPAAESVALAIL